MLAPTHSSVLACISANVAEGEGDEDVRFV
jgi:hypothetical protein